MWIDRRKHWAFLIEIDFSSAIKSPSAIALWKKNLYSLHTAYLYKFFIYIRMYGTNGHYFSFTGLLELVLYFMTEPSIAKEKNRIIKA